MPTSYKSRFEELCQAVREEREARKVGGDRLRKAVQRVTAITNDPEPEPQPDKE